MSYKRKKNHSGMTILEMFIAIGIFTMGMAGFTALFAKTWSSNSYTLEMGMSSMRVSRTVNSLVGYIRGARQSDNGAYPIVSAEENDLVIYSDYDKDGVTERIHIYKSGQDIMLGVREPSGTMPKTYASGDESVETITSYIVNDAATPIFQYYNKNYPGDAVNNPMSLPIALGDVRLVRIYLHININPNRAPDNIIMETFAEMRNLNDYDQLH